jgi:hypothetical protein
MLYAMTHWINKMKRILKISLLFVLTYLMTNCEDKLRIIEPMCSGPRYPPSNEDRVSVNQGMWGDVWFWEGNFQLCNPPGTITPVIRDLYIYEPVNLDDVNITLRDNGLFCSDVSSKLITIVKSDSTGYFEVELSPGSYSVLALEDTLFYIMSWKKDGNINLVNVYESEVTYIRYNIRYLAIS